MLPQQILKKRNDGFEAIILAGGRGSRLSPLTDSCPKPLLRVKDRLILEHIINEVSSSGISDITIATKYLSNQIHQHFSDKYRCVETPFETMIESFIHACSFSTKENLLCLSADTLLTKYSLIYSLDNHSRVGSDITLTLSETDRSRKKWAYIINNDGFLQDLSIGESDNNLERSGLVISRYIIDSLKDSIEKYDRNYLGFGSGWNLILRMMLDKGKKIYTSKKNFPIFNINTPTDLQEAELFVNENLK
ncbi:MAG: sugar phosphate nucleotidyltransferase [Nanoarchaeota archaeon]